MSETIAIPSQVAGRLMLGKHGSIQSSRASSWYISSAIDGRSRTGFVPNIAAA